MGILGMVSVALGKVVEPDFVVESFQPEGDYWLHLAQFTMHFTELPPNFDNDFLRAATYVSTREIPLPLLR